MIEVDNFRKIFVDILPSDNLGVVHIHEEGKHATVNDFFFEDSGTLFHFFRDAEIKKSDSTNQRTK